VTDALFRGPAAGAAASPLLSMPEIAALAQVKRPVVSTWRRRYTDFPAPVAEMAGRVQFDGEEIAQWLLATGLGNADPAQLRAELVLYSLAAHADRSDALRTVDTVGALLSLRYLDEQPLAEGNGEEATAPQRLWDAIMHRAERIDPDDEFLLRELHAAGKDAVPLVRLAEDMIEAAYGERGAYEWLLASRSRLPWPANRRPTSTRPRSTDRR
jgi:predicted DNA-binding transcriptional regulator AlpA